jgi:hypothetical protein
MRLRPACMLCCPCSGDTGREGERASGSRISPLLDAARRAWRHTISKHQARALLKCVQGQLELEHRGTTALAKRTLASYGGICSPRAASSA